MSACWHDESRARVSGLGRIYVTPEGNHQATIVTVDGRGYVGKGSTREDALRALAAQVVEGEATKESLL